jgi:hypothetical protein
LAVTVAERVCDLAGPGQVLVRETVRINMLGAGVEFEDQGEHESKGQRLVTAYNDAARPRFGEENVFLDCGTFRGRPVDHVEVQDFPATGSWTREGAWRSGS